MNLQVRFLKTIKITKEIKFESIIIIERKKEEDQRKRDRKHNDKDRKEDRERENKRIRSNHWVNRPTGLRWYLMCGRHLKSQIMVSCWHSNNIWLSIAETHFIQSAHPISRQRQGIRFSNTLDSRKSLGEASFQNTSYEPTPIKTGRPLKLTFITSPLIRKGVVELRMLAQRMRNIE